MTSGASVARPSTQLVDAWGLYEEAHGAVAEVFFEVHAAVDVDVEDDVLPFGELLLHLLLERAVVAVLVHFLVLYEVVVGNVLAELVRREEKVLHAMLLLSARWTCGG